MMVRSALSCMQMGWTESKLVQTIDVIDVINEKKATIKNCQFFYIGICRIHTRSFDRSINCTNLPSWRRLLVASEPPDRVPCSSSILWRTSKPSTLPSTRRGGCQVASSLGKRSVSSQEAVEVRCPLTKSDTILLTLICGFHFTSSRLGLHALT